MKRDPPLPLPALPRPAAPSSEWQADSWESARRRKLTLGLDASPAERMAWLEEAIAVAWASGALPRPRRTWDE